MNNASPKKGQYFRFGLYLFVLFYVAGTLIAFLRKDLYFCSDGIGICDRLGGLSVAVFLIRELMSIGVAGVGVAFILGIVALRESARRDP